VDIAVRRHRANGRHGANVTSYLKALGLFFDLPWPNKPPSGRYQHDQPLNPPAYNIIKIDLASNNAE
jgi:hypothetical protein